MTAKLVSIIGAVLLLARAGSGQTYLVGNTDNSATGYNPKSMYLPLFYPNLPVMDMYASDMMCRSLNMNDKVTPYPVTAGKTVPLTFKVGVSPISGKALKGPCSFYLSNVKTKGKGWAWFPIEINPFAQDRWCTEMIQNNGHEYDVVIPEWVPSGTYYLRTEIIDLTNNNVPNIQDFSRGPHFYVNCMAITVTSTSKISPKLYKIPGIYDNAEERFVVNVENSAASEAFILPGPAVNETIASNP
ncbi:hypothetical protein GGI24_005127 [Coemansia furcata]|nr:hypothetical protein GGI24_005127 [Coemansia furcata]